jgi:hypothetical protein
VKGGQDQECRFPLGVSKPLKGRESPVVCHDCRSY